MIADLKALEEIRSSWDGVEALRERLKVGLFASAGILGGVFPFHVADIANNLPFLSRTTLIVLNNRRSWLYVVRPCLAIVQKGNFF